MTVSIWSSRSSLRLLAVGCVMTLITHFPPSFLNTSTNTATTTIERYFNGSYTRRGHPLSFTQVSLLKSVMNSEWYAGQIFGSLVSPLICDNYGRKVAYLVSMLGMVGATVMQACAVCTVYPEIFLTGRLIAAIFSPICDNATILYLQETAPSALRGTLFSLYSVGYGVMSIVGMTLGQENVLGYSLPVLFVAPVVIGILSSLFALLLPETPKYLVVNKNDKLGALRSLRFFQGRNEQHDMDVEEMEKELAGGEHKKNSMMDVFRTRRLRKALLLSIVATVSSFPLFSLLQSSTHYFTAIGLEPSLAQYASSMLMAVFTMASIAAVFLVALIPRRALVLTAGASVAVSLLVFLSAERARLPWLGVAAAYVLIVAYGFGLGPVVWTMGTELVPTAYRSAIFAFMFATVNTLVVVTNFLSLALFDLIGSVCFVPIFVIPITIAEVLLYIYMPETRGKETHEIHCELKRRHGSRVQPVDTTDSLESE